MLRAVFKQELLDHIMSFRFSAITVLTILLMVLSALVFSSSYQRALMQYPTRVSTFVDEQGTVNLKMIACQGGATVREIPSPLAFCSGSGERELPNEAAMAVHGLSDVQRGAEPGDILSNGGSLDWAFVVAVLLSFGAGLLTYKSISGERRDGTLTLVLSNPVPRSTILAGRYLAALSALVVVFLFAVACGLIVLQSSGALQLRGDDWFKVAFFVLLSIVYLSLFVMTGLLCSVFAKGPVLSAVAFVFVWTALVFIVPNLSGLLAGELGSVRTPSQIHQTAGTIPDQYTLTAAMGADEVAAVKIRRETAREALLLDYIQSLVQQVRFGENLTSLSPASVFSSAAERIVGGGTVRLMYFIGNAARYREGFYRAILDADKKDPRSEHRYVPWNCGGSHFSELTVDPGPAKEFHDVLPSSGEGLVASAWGFAQLILYNLIAFALAFWRFARQDVAPTPGV